MRSRSDFEMTLGRPLDLRDAQIRRSDAHTLIDLPRRRPTTLIFLSASRLRDMPATLASRRPVLQNEQVTTHWLERSAPLTIDDYLAIDEVARQNIEVVDGFAVPREQRDRAHQKTGFRLAEALETAAAKFRRDHESGSPPCIEVNTEVDLILWQIPLTVRKPDVVVHYCLDQFEVLEARDVLIAVEVLSRWSESRDRIHKKGEYAKAGIPHYLIVQFDEIGATIVEHYALLDGRPAYAKIGISHRDRDPVALAVTTPFSFSIQWQDLEIAPRV